MSENFRYHKILLPLDTSTVSEGVLPHVRTLARGLALPVELLCVSDPARRPFTTPGENRDYLERIAGSFETPSMVRIRVELGEPADSIVELASAEPSTLIAMATHGRSGVKRWLLGSVAEKVLRTARNDLLVVRPLTGNHGSEALFKGIVVPLDGSAIAERALPVATSLAIRLKLKVVLLRAVIRVQVAPPEAILPVFGAHIPDPNRLWAEAREQSRNYLDTRTARLRAEGLSDVSSALIEGSEGAAAAIIEAAAKNGDTLVIMTDCGRSGIARWAIGSVTESVVRGSDRPVLIVRTRP
jgi:nucleotide-binding universal stress UspA family protein